MESLRGVTGGEMRPTGKQVPFSSLFCLHPLLTSIDLSDPVLSIHTHIHLLPIHACIHGSIHPRELASSIGS